MRRAPLQVDVGSYRKQPNSKELVRLCASLKKVEWASISEEGVDMVIAYATTPDHDIDTYQSSKAVLSALASSTEVG